MGAPIIELRDVTKSYGAFDALRGVTFTVHSGEVTCVLGDNGAGKSTLIKVLAGLHTPTAGELLIDAAPVRFGSPRAGGWAMGLARRLGALRLVC